MNCVVIIVGFPEESLYWLVACRWWFTQDGSIDRGLLDEIRDGGMWLIFPLEFCGRNSLCIGSRVVVTSSYKPI